jgi:hypothetical protein
MIEVQMLIPVTNNAGVRFSDAHFAVFEDHITETFGGYSLLPSEVAGGWRNDAGIIYRDRSRVYAVAIVSLTDGSRIGDLATFAKAHFEQEAIAVRYLGQIEIL